MLLSWKLSLTVETRTPSTDGRLSEVLSRLISGGSNILGLRPDGHHLWAHTLSRDAQTGDGLACQAKSRSFKSS